MKEPPGLVPFSSRVTRAPSSVALRAAVRPASPPPAMTTRTGATLGQGERRLVLHVLHAHALWSANEDGEGVRAFYEVLHLKPPLLGLLAVVLSRIYEATDVEEHASSVCIRGRTGEAHAVLPSPHEGGVVAGGKAHLDEGARGLLGGFRPQDEATQVVVGELSFAGNQGEREHFRARESVPSVARFGPGLSRESRRGTLRVDHAYGYAFDLPRRRRRTLRGVEQGEFAEPATGPHQGVTFRAVHDVEPEVRGQEPGGFVPVFHVEGYVIQHPYLHAFSLLNRSPGRR